LPMATFETTINMLAPELAIDTELVPLAMVVTETFAAAVTLLRNPPSPTKNAPVEIFPATENAPEVSKFPPEMLPVTLTVVPVCVTALTLPAVILPVELIIPPVSKLPAVMLPLALKVVGDNVPMIFPP